VALFLSAGIAHRAKKTRLSDIKRMSALRIWASDDQVQVVSCEISSAAMDEIAGTTARCLLTEKLSFYSCGIASSALRLTFSAGDRARSRQR
jgi:hypothetical protein